MGFDYNKVKDPQFFAENRVSAHSDHVFYKSWDEFAAQDSSYSQCLNGLWKFSYAKNYESTIKGFETAEYDCEKWDDIRVPAHIQMEGYDVPQYANVQYPWDGREQILPGEIPEEFNPVASYAKYFTLPEKMAGTEKLFISFGGVESGFAIWLNGKYVGYSEDSFTTADFELTPYLQSGTNKLALQVFKWCGGSWLEDQDFYRFSGIFRDVCLYTTPAVHAVDIKVETELDAAYTNAVLRLTIKKQGANGNIRAYLQKDNITVFETDKPLTDTTVLEQEIEAAMLWSAEAPNLYQLKIEIYDANGSLQEVISENVGFRTFEIKDGIMCINGKRIEFNGANRHEYGYINGRVMSVEDTITDIVTMKRNNINAIRTSHYPNNTFLYKLCDIYGLYIIDEVNMETHGTWDLIARSKTPDFSVAVPGDRPEWLENVLYRVNNLYQRDKNRPCVVIWSLGNESFGGKNIFEMSQLFRKLDKSRVIHYEGVANDRRYNDSSDIESRMYPSATAAAQWLKEHRDKPYILCEYAHAMGNSLGAIHKYTDLLEQDPLYQGVFIWDYVDQGVLKKDRYGKDFVAYGGDFDEYPNDRDFCANGIVYADRTETPMMQEVKYVYQGIKVKVDGTKVEINNRYLFTSTAEYACEVVVKKEGMEIARASLETDVQPISKKVYDLPVLIPEKSGEYTVTVSFSLKKDTIWAKAGHEVAFGQGVVKIQENTAETFAKKPRLIAGWHNVGVKGEHFEVLFSKLYGGLVSYRYGGKEMLKGTPKPNFWRAPTQNDNGNFMAARYGQWLLASLYTMNHPTDVNTTSANVALENPITKELEHSIKVSYTYLLPTKPASECVMSYNVFGDGTVETTLEYTPVDGLTPMPEFGAILKMDADFDRIEWYGNGPAETYADRKHGAKLDVYKQLVKDGVAPHNLPQETGSKTDVRWAKVTDLRGRGLLFTADNMEFSALPYTPFELENAAHHTELPPVYYTVVRPALKRMGVAGDDSWGAQTHDEYLVHTDKPLKFTFKFKGI